MTEFVVDKLEPVDVTEEHRQQPAVGCALVQGMLDPVGQQCPVGQPGECVMLRQVLESGFGQPLTTQVRHDEAGDVRAARIQPHGRADPNGNDVAGAGQQLCFDCPGGCGSDDPGEDFPTRRRDQFADVVSDDGVVGEHEEVGQRGVGVEHDPVTGDRGRAAGHVLHERPVRPVGTGQRENALVAGRRRDDHRVDLAVADRPEGRIGGRETFSQLDDPCPEPGDVVGVDRMQLERDVRRFLGHAHERPPTGTSRLGR